MGNGNSLVSPRGMLVKGNSVPISASSSILLTKRISQSHSQSDMSDGNNGGKSYRFNFPTTRNSINLDEIATKNNGPTDQQISSINVGSKYYTNPKFDYVRLRHITTTGDTRLSLKSSNVNNESIRNDSADDHDLSKELLRFSQMGNFKRNRIRFINKIYLNFCHEFKGL